LGKKICISTNGFGLGEEADFEVQNFLPSQTLKKAQRLINW
jgi:hypothetical protein